MKTLLRAAALALLAPMVLTWPSALADRMVPSTLPEGGEFRVASLQRSAGGAVLHVPGREPIPVRSPERWPNGLYEVEGGHLVTMQGQVSVPGHLTPVPTEQVVFVGDGGGVRVLVESTRYQLAGVSSDGRSWVGTWHDLPDNGRYTWSMRRYRVIDGAVLETSRSRRVRSLSLPTAGVVSPQGVLVNWRDRSGLRTALLDVGSDRVRPLDLPPRRTSPWRPVPSARAGTVPVAGRAVLDARTGRELWHTGRREALGLPSPNGRNMLTTGREGYFQQSSSYVRGLTVRRTRTGAVRASFDGYFDVRGDPRPRGVVWETNNSFVAYAYDDIVLHDGDEGHAVGGTRVRCRITTATCERVPLLDSPDGFTPLSVIRPSR